MVLQRRAVAFRIEGVGAGRLRIANPRIARPRKDLEKVAVNRIQEVAAAERPPPAETTEASAVVEPAAAAAVLESTGSCSWSRLEQSPKRKFRSLDSRAGLFSFLIPSGYLRLKR